jgi:deoxyribonuclease-4
MRIGRHMPTHSDAVKAAYIARGIGCETIQIFASNPTAWRPPADDQARYLAFAQATRELDLQPVVLHAPYLINLGTLDEVIWEKSIALLSWTLQRGGLLGASHVVFHTGSHKGAGVEMGIERVVQGIERILPETPTNVKLLLENASGAGNALGNTFDQLAAILQRLVPYRDRLGICLDTAHMWGAGYDISHAVGVQQILDECDEAFGLQRLEVIHLNDTAVELASRRDLHKRVGEGVIGEEGLSSLLQDPRVAHCAVILETPIKQDANDREDWAQDAFEIAKVWRLAGRDVVAVKQEQGLQPQGLPEPVSEPPELPEQEL